MAITRPYIVRIAGVDRMVEAGSSTRAKRHVVNAELARISAQIEECRPARANDVVAFTRAGGIVEVEGVYPEPEKEEEPRGDLLGALKDGIQAEKGDESTAESGHGGH